ncbi:MAG: helix-turn-helix domain-containing protein, partial [Clostridiales bacterium]|nr:helix-turn-helix domain-containing protein [Clostridiales bacterium]
LSQQVVSRMESDRSCIRVRSLIALADYFQVSTDEILGYESEAAKEERIRLEKELEVETACHLPETKSVSAAEQSAVYNFLVGMKRCLEECGI